MPRIAQTVIRNRTYFMRVRVPTELVKAIGRKEITKTLKTSDPKEAKRRLYQELLHLQAEFDGLRNRQKLADRAKHSLDDLSKGEIASLVLKWLEKRDEENRSYNPPDELREDVDMTLLEEEGLAVDALREKNYGSVENIAEKLLDDANIAFNPKSKEFTRLSELLLRARLEIVKRAQQDHHGAPIVGTGDPLFANLSGLGSLPTAILGKNKMTFNELCKLYEADREGHVRSRVLRGIQEEIKVFKQLIEPETIIQEISKDQCREIFDLMKKLPSHAAKIYPKVGLRRAIELAEKEHKPRIGPKRINAYMLRLRALFAYAVEEEYLPNNPVSKKFKVKDSRLKRNLRNPFSVEQLQTIFNAPLYTGCIDDKYGAHKVGTQKPKRARFWVPLIALWTGMRLEEICQLDTKDIQNLEGVDVLQVYPSDTKNVKTEDSIRTIPVHDELKKIGFLEYAKEIRDKGHAKLFPELEISSTGNYSLAFSKWFGRFLTMLQIDDPKLVFHSFRHNFRDALRDVEVPMQYVEILGGWSGDAVANNYGKGEKPSKLNKYHKRINYPGLNLSHLYVNNGKI